MQTAAKPEFKYEFMDLFVCLFVCIHFFSAFVPNAATTTRSPTFRA